MEIKPPKHRNSAGRLLALLTAIDPNKPAFHALPIAYGYKASSQEEFQRYTILCLISVHELYVQFKEDLQAHAINDEQLDVLLAGTSNLEQIIYPVQLNGTLRQMTEAEKSLLKVCATIIPQDEEVTESDLEMIRESIANLRSDIEKGDIAPSLRKVLLELVRLSEDAIARFNIHGARGLKIAFKRMLGEVIDAHQTAVVAGDAANYQNRSVWNKIKMHLGTFDAVAAKALKYVPVLESLAKFILDNNGKQ